MNSKTIVLVVQCLASTCLFAGKEQVSWDERPTGCRDNAADRWWCSTWRHGDHVETVSDYQFSGNLKLEEKNLTKVRWWEFKKKYLAADLEASLSGVTKMSTDVLVGNGRSGEPLPKGVPLQLLRTYESPMSFRAIGVCGLKNGLEVEKNLRSRQIELAEALEDPKYSDLRRAAKQASVVVVTKLIRYGSSGLATIPGCQWAAVGATPGVSELIANKTVDISSEFASEKMKQWRKENLVKLANGELDGDGVEVKSKGWFYWLFKSNDMDKVANLATAFNGLFNFSTVYMSGEQGRPLFAKQIKKGEAGWRLLMNPKESGLGDNAAGMDRQMRELPLSPDDNRARNVLMRETLDINAKLFDAKKRTPGDAWFVEASIFNGFLHQDIQGSFEGTIVMEYLGDEDCSLTKFGPDIGATVLPVRHLRMKKSHMGTYTSFKYSEDEGFNMAYEPRHDTEGQASLDVYVDRNSGYIVKLEIEMKRANIKVLPQLKLSDGFSCGDGDFAFKVASETFPMPNVDAYLKWVQKNN